MSRLCEGRVVVVTGSGRGIGREHALSLAKHGALVVVNDLGAGVDGSGGDTSPAQQVVNEIEAMGGRAVANGDDISTWAGAERLINTAVETFGDLHAVVNNAGILRDRMMANMSEEEWDAVINVNLNSLFITTQAVLPHMREARYGRIISASSINGFAGAFGQTNYSASKAGVIGFSKSVALELGSRNIRCNVIAPGFIETEMTAKLDEKTVDVWRNAIPLKRGGSPEDIANAAVYLASEEARYITGHTLVVDAGATTLGGTGRFHQQDASLLREAGVREPA